MLVDEFLINGIAFQRLNQLELRHKARRKCQTHTIVLGLSTQRHVSHQGWLIGIDPPGAYAQVMPVASHSLVQIAHDHADLTYPAQFGQV